MQLQTAVDALAEWGHSHEPTMSQVLTVSHQIHHQPRPIPPATLNGVAIEEAEELKLLGVLFDRSLPSTPASDKLQSVVTNVLAS